MGKSKTLTLFVWAHVQYVDVSILQSIVQEGAVTQATAFSNAVLLDKRKWSSALPM